MISNHSSLKSKHNKMSSEEKNGENDDPLSQNKYLSLLIQFMISTTWDGLPNLIRARNWIIRIAWAIVIIASTVYCAFSKI